MKFVLPVNIFFKNQATTVKKQLERITSNNPQMQGFWDGFNQKYAKTQELATNTDTSINTPLILYFIAAQIKDKLTNPWETTPPPSYFDIISSVATLWGEIERRLENTIADPSILYGTDLFQDIFYQAYLNHAQTTKYWHSGTPRYSSDMEALFEKIELYTARVPHLYLQFAQSQKNSMSFNGYLNEHEFNTLDSLQDNKVKWQPGPNIFPAPTPPEFEWTSPRTWIYRLRTIYSNFITSPTAPDHFNGDMECTLTQITTKNHQHLMTLANNTWEDNWIERERLLWCYANATLLDESKDGSATPLICIALYSFNEKSSLISKAFVQAFNSGADELSLLKKIQMPKGAELTALITALSGLSQDERSDWIEGLLLLQVIGENKLGNIKNSQMLANVKALAFSNPLAFSQAYSNVENSYRERFLHYLKSDQTATLTTSGYANEVIELMDLYTRSGFMPTMNYVWRYIVNFCFEQPSWCYNHPYGTFFMVATTVLLSFFPVVAILELTGFVAAVEEFFGAIGGAIISRTSASFLKQIFFMPVDHLIHTVDKTDIESALKFKEASAQYIAGGTIKKGSGLQTIKNPQQPHNNTFVDQNLSSYWGDLVTTASSRPVTPQLYNTRPSSAPIPIPIPPPNLSYNPDSRLSRSL